MENCTFSEAIKFGTSLQVMNQCKYLTQMKDSVLEKLIDDLEQNLFNQTLIYIEVDDILEREDILNMTGQVLIYLIHCPSKYEISTITFLTNLLQQYPVRRIILTLNQLLTIFEDNLEVYHLERNITYTMLDRLTNLLKLNHKAIKLMTSSDTLIKLSPNLRHYYQSFLENNPTDRKTSQGKSPDFYGKRPCHLNINYYLVFNHCLLSRH